MIIMSKTPYSFSSPTWDSNVMVSYVMLTDRLQSALPAGFRPCEPPCWATGAYRHGTRGVAIVVEDYDMGGNAKVKLHFVNFSEEEADEIKGKL